MGVCMTKNDLEASGLGLTKTCLPYMFATATERRCIDDEALQENSTRVAIRMALQNTSPCFSLSCPSAMSSFLCAQSYPMCDEAGYLLPTCRSTCQNARQLCTCPREDAAADCLEFDGVGPSSTCTGAGFALRASSLLIAGVLAFFLF
eukprot:EC838760.1.p2 GENE.EC838760.1~~EC838760.1.p2  ORF type:complete len:174 (-),score=29.07 EC838760.1:102-545(-)